MTSPVEAKSLNWIQLLATVSVAIGVLCGVLWFWGRVQADQGIFFLFAGAVLFMLSGAGLWVLGAFVAGVRGRK